jgi:hypothetical protein
LDPRSERWRVDAAEGLARVAAMRGARGAPASARDIDDADRLDLRRSDGPSEASLVLVALAALSAAVGAVWVATYGAGARLGQVLLAIGLVSYVILLLLN